MPREFNSTEEAKAAAAQYFNLDPKSVKFKEVEHLKPNGLIELFCDLSSATRKIGKSIGKIENVQYIFELEVPEKGKFRLVIRSCEKGFSCIIIGKGKKNRFACRL